MRVRRGVQMLHFEELLELLTGVELDIQDILGITISCSLEMLHAAFTSVFAILAVASHVLVRGALLQQVLDFLA